MLRIRVCVCVFCVFLYLCIRVFVYLCICVCALNCVIVCLCVCVLHNSAVVAKQTARHPLFNLLPKAFRQFEFAFGFRAHQADPVMWQSSHRVLRAFRADERTQVDRELYTEMLDRTPGPGLTGSGGKR